MNERFSHYDLLLQVCLTVPKWVGVCAMRVQKVVSSCFSTIRLLSRIKHFLVTEQLQLLVCSLVLSVIDYCNILYYGMSNDNLKKLQSVQNTAARLACKVNSYDRISSDELFRKLH